MDRRTFLRGATAAASVAGLSKAAKAAVDLPFNRRGLITHRPPAAPQATGFSLSWLPPPGSDTEARQLVRHAGSLYCFCGQWEASDPSSGPQVMRQDSASTPWVIDTTFASYLMACASGAELRFPSAGVKMLATGFWGRSWVGTKTPSGWVTTPIGSQYTSLVEVRSWASYTDPITQVDYVFAGHDQGIFRGVYDPAAPGLINWAPVPEIDITSFPRLDYGKYHVRVMSMAVLGTGAAATLYATIGQGVYRRNNGPTPSWTLVKTNPAYDPSSQSGLRGMTVIKGQLWICPEGTSCGVAAFNPNTLSWTYQWGPTNYYDILGYNDICVVPQSNGSTSILAGFDGYQYGPASYLALYNGVWTIRAIPSLRTQPMVSCRSIHISPFDQTVAYFSGYDCNNYYPETNTAWIATSSLAGPAFSETARLGMTEIKLENGAVATAVAPNPSSTVS